MHSLYRLSLSLLICVGIASCSHSLQSTASKAQTPQQVFKAYQDVLQAAQDPQFNQSVAYTNQVVDAYNTLTNKVNRMQPYQQETLQLLCTQNPNFMQWLQYFEKTQVPQIIPNQDILSEYGTWNTPKPKHEMPYALRVLLKGS